MTIGLTLGFLHGYSTVYYEEELNYLLLVNASVELTPVNLILG